MTQDLRQTYVEHLLAIDNKDIIDSIYSQSFELLKIELDRHNKIVEKGRNYLSINLILIGIILTSGNLIFSNSSLQDILTNLQIYLIGGLFVFSIIVITISLFYNLYISFIHSYLWFNFDDLCSVPDSEENTEYLYQIGQISGYWDKINGLTDGNEKLVTKLKMSSVLSVISILMLSALVLIALYTKLYGIIS